MKRITKKKDDRPVKNGRKGKKKKKRDDVRMEYRKKQADEEK